jgi:hypothetical protein
LTYRFLVEAKRLWELEGGQPKLTTIQAGCLITAAMDVIGHDKPGIAYTLIALSLAQRMGVFRPPQTTNKKLENAKAFTAWSLSTWLT